MLKNIPKVDKVLDWPEIKGFLDEFQRPILLKIVRMVLDRCRSGIIAGEEKFQGLSQEMVVEMIRRELTATRMMSLKRVVNGTGVVIHTNLGRSPLPETALEAILNVAAGYSNLEYELEKGIRGRRHSHVEKLLCELTGAEAALVVNNNAAAVLLALAGLASGKEVLVSRGELVEIGGSFRIPDVMRQSGAVMKEVGATNRTHPSDYRQAVSPDTGLFLKVHPSNYAIVGFTSEVPAEQLVSLAREFSLPVMADLGSGNLVDLSSLLGHSEPTVQELVKAGVDLVTFSGDKLLGGPQAGIIVGRKSLLEKLSRHPLMRALRIDKLTLAALEATLRLYRDERQALASIPTLRMLVATPAELAATGRRILARLRRVVQPTVRLALVSGVSQVGGGAFPLLELPTRMIAVEVSNWSPQKLETAMRTGVNPVLGRICKDRFLLDIRTLMAEDIPLMVEAFRSIGE